jgi:hypothetical protein
VLIVGWGAVIVLLELEWPDEPFYLWFGLAMIALGLFGLTPWGRRL